MEHTFPAARRNAVWIISCKCLQSLLQLAVGMYTARYLGPDNYGLIAYAAALTAFFTPIMHLGLRSTLVQELVERPQDSGVVLGTAMTIALGSAGLCIAAIVLLARGMNPQSRETVVVCGVYSLVLLCQAWGLLEHWFRAKLLSKYTARLTLLGYLAVACYRIFLLATGQRVVWFALASALDGLILAAGLTICYRKCQGQPLRFSRKLAAAMLHRSKYYILPGILVAAQQQLDRILVSAMLNPHHAGCYAAAATCAGLGGFVYGAIIDSAQPGILEAHRVSDEAFAQKLRQLYALIFFLAMAQSLVVAMGAGPMVELLYGPEYSGSIPALAILTWSLGFSYLGSVRSIWILAKQRQRFLWVVYLVGASVNLGLNLVLIPRWGICGAAAATVLSQLVTNVGIGFFFPPLRPGNQILMQALHPSSVLESLRAGGRMLQRANKSQEESMDGTSDQ